MAVFLKWYGENVKKEVAGKAMRGITRACIEIKNEAARRCPASDGTLRSNISYEVTMAPNYVVGRVGTNLKYAKWVELGSHPHFAPVGNWAVKHGFPPGTTWLYVSGKAQPFLVPAWEMHKDWRKFV